MPKRGRAEVAVIGILLLLVLSSTDASALTLPNPPDRSAPSNNQTGPLPSTGPRSFAGGVFLVKDGSTNQSVTTNELIVSYFCATTTLNLAKQYNTAFGESISGPISNDQASGVIDAIDSVRPPTTVGLPMSLTGVYGGNLTYYLTGISYNVTTYSVWVTTQPSPAEQRVGYVVVGVPEKLQVGRTSTDLAGAFCPAIGDIRLGAGFGSGPWAWLTAPFSSLSIPPEGGLAPIITYGTVKVTSSAGVAGVANIRAGENATFVLPPGTYSAVADVALFGIPLRIGAGTYSSPPGASAAQFAVSLASVYDLWYAFEIVVAVIVIVVIGILARRFHMWHAIVQGSARLSRALRSGWEALARQWHGDGGANTLIGSRVGRSEQGSGRWLKRR